MAGTRRAERGGTTPRSAGDSEGPDDVQGAVRRGAGGDEAGDGGDVAAGGHEGRLDGPYDAELGTLLRRAAKDARVPLEQGLYAAMLGPSYETPAEIRALRALGAHAVGMSTVAEARWV